MTVLISNLFKDSLDFQSSCIAGSCITGNFFAASEISVVLSVMALAIGLDQFAVFSRIKVFCQNVF